MYIYKEKVGLKESGREREREMRVRLESEDDVASVASSISGAVNAVLESRLRAGVSQERMDALSGVLKKMAVRGGGGSDGGTGGHLNEDVDVDIRVHLRT